MMIFQDRFDAGRQLAKKLGRYQHEKPFILALPRGGVVVGYEVAKALHASLDIIVSRKLGAPGQPELGFGAIAPNGIRILNQDIIHALRLTSPEIERVTAQEQREMLRRLKLYRDDMPMPDLLHRTVILVDDGLATGVTALAAVHSIRTMHPKKIILAVPVSAIETADNLRREVDDLVCIQIPFDFLAVGVWYQHFDQVTDQEVIELLHCAKMEVESK